MGGLNMSDLQKRYQEVYEGLKDACRKAGRPEDSVRLIAVSKNFPVEDIMQIYQLGQREFGENRAQEVTAKYPELPQDIKWHFIGRLQRNKVKYIIDKVYMIHSVDKVSLAQEISRQAVLKNVIMPVLIQVNLEGEETKAGFRKEELPSVLKEIAVLPNIQVKGLMTIGAYHENPEDSRPLFKRMKALFDEIAGWQIPGVTMEYLSMGMSNDYKVAIEEGANFVRVGSLIFGERIYA